METNLILTKDELINDEGQTDKRQKNKEGQT